jgi:hypothetical protein
MNTTPTSVHDALRRITSLLTAVGLDIEEYLEHPANYQPEYFNDVLQAVLDAQLLVVWTRDQMKAKS